MSFASDLFDAQLSVYRQESLLYDLIESFGLGEKGWEDWSYDYYDTSLELYGVPPDLRLSDDAVAKAKEADFSIVWLNHTDGWETMYSLHRGESYRTNRGQSKTTVENFACKELRRQLAGAAQPAKGERE